MLSVFMMFLGLGLMIWSLYSIRKEIENGNLRLTKGLSGVSDRNLERIVHYLDGLEKQMDEMNIAFYDLVSDLEGSFSVHDKELSLMEERLQRMEKQLSLLTSEVRIEHPLTEIKSVSKVRAYQQTDEAKRYRRPTQTELSARNSETAPAEPPPTAKPDFEEPQSSQQMLRLSPDEAQAMKQRILALRKEGHSLSQIAKILKVGIGELQLFIKLNTK